MRLSAITVDPVTTMRIIARTNTPVNARSAELAARWTSGATGEAVPTIGRFEFRYRRVDSCEPDEHFVHARVLREFRVERSREQVPLGGEDPEIAHLGQELGAPVSTPDRRGADEHGVERRPESFYRKVGLKRLSLPPEGIAVDIDVHEAKEVGARLGDLVIAALRDHDHAGAGAEERKRAFASPAFRGFEEAVGVKHLRDRRALAAGQDERVAALEVWAAADGGCFGLHAKVRSCALDGVKVLRNVALDGEHADALHAPRQAGSGKKDDGGDSPLVLGALLVLGKRLLHPLLQELGLDLLERNERHPARAVLPLFKLEKPTRLQFVEVLPELR
jgi:hypothetical protein